jgi:hypothetical protein
MIDGPGEVGDTDVRRERTGAGVRRAWIHLPGYAAIAEVAGGERSEVLQMY